MTGLPNVHGRHHSLAQYDEEEDHKLNVSEVEVLHTVVDREVRPRHGAALGRFLELRPDGSPVAEGVRQE